MSSKTETSAPPPLAPPAPSVPLSESPEFRAAVAKALQDALPDFLAKLPASTAPAPAADLQSLFSQMALSIAQMNDQGTSRMPGQRVAPEVLEQRRLARERMTDILIEVRNELRAAKNSGGKEAFKAARAKFLPRYRLIAKCYLGETLYEPLVMDPATKQPVPVMISWTGEPNDAMQPVNDIAKRIHTEFRASRGATARVVDTSDRQYWMSAEGHVIKGTAPARRAVTLEDPEEFVDAVEADDDFSLPPLKDPNAAYIPVLGTIAPPAMQNYQGKVP